ncbi:MAG: outer membrane protein transport protein [Deltaproteobacteria bacterium]|nr:outer membrane protein transport protein [Deltaproteobacteria bacterium]
MKSRLAILALAGTTMPAGAAWADGGYYSGTLGAKATGRGGAFAAKADDLSAVSFNPAGLANIEDTLIEVGNQVSYNAYSYTRAPTYDYGHPDGTGAFPLVAFDKVSNSKPWQALVPMLGVASRLGLRDWAFALAFAPQPGISQLAFPLFPLTSAIAENGKRDGQRYMMIDREAMILKYVASAAWKYGEIFGVGASAEWIHVPRLKYSLMIDGSAFADVANPVWSDYDMLVRLEGSSPFTFNATLGAWYRPVPSLVFGLSAQVVPTSIVADSTLNLTAFGGGFGSEGVYLTGRTGAPANDVTLTLPLPLLARVAVRYRNLVNNRERFDVELDVEYVTWSRVKDFTIETNGLQANYGPTTIDIEPIHIAKQWRDTIAVRLGGDCAVLPGALTLRAGGYYESAVADPAYAHVDFPGAAQYGGALGASLFVRRFELVAAYMFKLQPSVSVSEGQARVYQQVPGSPCAEDPTLCNPNLTGPAPVVNAGAYSASSHFLSLSVLYRFGL